MDGEGPERTGPCWEQKGWDPWPLARGVQPPSPQGPEPFLQGIGLLGPQKLSSSTQHFLLLRARGWAGQGSQPSRKPAQGPRCGSETLCGNLQPGAGVRGFPWSRFLVVLPTSPYLLPKETMQINHFCLGVSSAAPLRPSVISGNPSPTGTWKLLGVCTGCFHGRFCALRTFRGLQGQWHCLDKPEVTSLGSFSQCQSCPGSEVPPKFAAQSLPVPSPRGERWGGHSEPRQAGSPGRAGTAGQANSLHRKPRPPRPARPPAPEPGRGGPQSGPKQGQGPGVSPGQGRSQQPSSPLSQTLPGEGRKPSGQARCYLFKSTEILSAAQPSSGFTGRKGARSRGAAVWLGLAPPAQI